jgi:hypothetical protein
MCVHGLEIWTAQVAATEPTQVQMSIHLQLDKRLSDLGAASTCIVLLEHSHTYKILRNIMAAFLLLACLW